MGYVKANKDELKNLKTSISDIDTELETANSTISSFKGAAESLANKWTGNVASQAEKDCAYALPNKANYDMNVLTEEMMYTKALGEYNRKLEAKKQEYTDKINEFKGYASTIDSGNIASAQADLTTISSAFEKITDAIDEFEGTSPSLEKALEDVQAKEGYKIDSESVKVEIGDEVYNVEVVKFEYDGQEYTISELVNAFYTTVGTIGNGAVAMASAYDVDSDGNVTSDDFFSNLSKGIDDINAKVSEYLGKGFYSVASTGNIDSMYKDAMNNKDADVASDYANFLESLSDKDSIYADVMANWTGADRTKSMAVSGLLMGLGAYTLTDYMNDQNDTKNELTPKNGNTESTDVTKSVLDGTTAASEYVSNSAAASSNGGYTSGSGSSSGGTSGGGGSNNNNNSNTDSDKEKEKEKEANKEKEKENEKETDKDKDPTKNAEAPVEVTKQEERGNLPEKVETDLGTKDYDELAREQFEAQGDAKIAENRAKITEEANKLFEAEDKTELINKLKEYGYTNMDIDDIIQDRNLVTSALIEGDQRQQLATMANNLAKADGVKDFDTAYDEGQSCHGFYDGSSEALLSNVSADPTVATAKTALTDATTKYTESVKTAQESITKVNEAQKTVETTKAEIVKSVASDTKNWSTTQQTKYSTELKTAQDAFIKKNGDATKWDATKVNEYQKIETNLKNKYVSEIQKDSSKWSNDQIEKYNKSVENYNTALKDANTKYEASQTAKTSYETSKANYEKARETYLKNVQNANKKDTYNSSGNTDTSLPSNGVQDPTTNTGSTPANTVGISDDQLLNGVNSNSNGASLG